MSRILSDWLEHYMKFSENSEPPVLYHLWSGITAISSALRRKCYTNWGHRGYVYPNFYICLIGPPGGRKGTAMKIAKNLVQKLKIPMGSDSVGSVQALYNEIQKSNASYKEFDGKMKQHKSLSIWSEEFQVFLSDKDPKLLGSITDLFDCPPNWNYTSIGRGDTDISNCFLTIIGAMTPSLLQTKLSLDAIGGGLISRIIFVVGYGAIKKIPFSIMTQEEMKLEVDLSNDLQRIAQLKGPFRMETPFMSRYAQWYTHATDDDSVISEKFVGYNARRALHLNKLCMIVAASENDEMLLQPHHFDLALSILEATESEMVNAFHGFGMGSHASKMAKILSWVESQKEFTHIDLLDKFYLDAVPEDLSMFMKVSSDRGMITITNTPTGTFYKVHTKKIKSKGTEYLDKTVYRLMTHNVIKGAKNE